MSPYGSSCRLIHHHLSRSAHSRRILNRHRGFYDRWTASCYNKRFERRLSRRWLCDKRVLACYAVGAPVIACADAGLEPRRLLAIGLSGFSIANLIAGWRRTAPVCSLRDRCWPSLQPTLCRLRVRQRNGNLASIRPKSSRTMKIAFIRIAIFLIATTWESDQCLHMD